MSASDPRPVLGFDYGDRHVGVAVGQPLTGSARPVARVRRPRNSAGWRVLDALVDEWQPRVLVVGLPLNMDASEQPVTGRARGFANELAARYALTTHLHDERLSTREARERALASGHDPASNDAFAAAVIVEGWLLATGGGESGG